MSQSFVMVSQPPPALTPTLPFLSSPDSLNPPSASNTSPVHEPRPNYYPSSVTLEGDSKPKAEFDLNALSNTHNPGESGSDHDYLHAHTASRPILETDGVVSSEVGDVPGILHQDLHPDGQPRRPMNAFMIFARHRRPVVQAKEPGLKTGEISKRLSHDWKNLPEEDKSHYLEQAKLLKDEFHSRFPEYVYKRRPNNTGKRRSSTSQQQLHPKFVCGSGASQPLSLPSSIHGCMSHPSEIHPHHYHQHLHPTHGEMYHHHPSHSHHLHHHSHVQPPSRPLSSIAQHSPKLASPNFYPTNPTSPRYHHVGHPSNCTTLAPMHPGPYAACGPPMPPAPSAIASSALHSPRPGSPVSSTSVTPNGMSYMRLSNTHTVSYQPQPSSNQYHWFSDESSYGSPSSHHVGTGQTPLSANRSSFSYPPWPPSVASDSHNISTCGPNGLEESDPTQSTNHSRAASYSTGPPIYRPASPNDRARQLSLPSHPLTASAGEASNGLSSDSASAYHDRLHHNHNRHSSSAVVQNANNHNFDTYGASDILNGSQRPSYSALSTTTGYGAGSVRNGLTSSSNAPQVNSDTPTGFEQHPSTSVNQSSNPNTSQSSKNHFSTNCSPLHHPAPPPPPPAAATSHHHHQHSSSSATSINTATSLAY